VIGRLSPYEIFWDPGKGIFRNYYCQKFTVLFILHVSSCKETALVIKPEMGFFLNKTSKMTMFLCQVIMQIILTKVNLLICLTQTGAVSPNSHLN